MLRWIPLLALTGCEWVLGLHDFHHPPVDAQIDTGVDVPSHDEDGDGIPDVLDVCPNVQDPVQADTDGDGVGDACDPNPLDPTEKRVWFETFENYAAHWSAPTTGTWVQGNDEVTITTTTAMDELLVLDGGTLDHPSILATFVPGPGAFADVGAIVALALPGGPPPALDCYLRNTMRDMELYDNRNQPPAIQDFALESNGSPMLSMWVMASSKRVGTGGPLCIGSFVGATPTMMAASDTTPIAQGYVAIYTFGGPATFRSADVVAHQ